MISKRLLALCGAAVIVCAPANAARYLWTFTGGVSGSGDLYTSDTLNALNGYNATSISGTMGGEAIAGLVANPNAPGYSSSGPFSFNNVVYPTSPYLDDFGLLFTTTSGISWNVLSSGGDLAIKFTGTRPTTTFSGTFTLTLAPEVPEPASWALMIGGLGLVGASLRRRSLKGAFKLA